MAKRKRENNEKQNEKRDKEGRGQGRFDQYKPWLKIQDVGSQGLAARIRGSKSGRIHHFFSGLELDYFYTLSWSGEVIDIREQYPLDLGETKALAKEVGLIHPPRSAPQKPIIMTTDFLITVRQPIGTKEVARTVKYSKDLTNSRVLEKFEIERLFWEERIIDWGIVTELDINKTLVRNVKWLYSYLEINSLPPNVIPIIPSLADYLLSRIKTGDTPLKEITRDCDREFLLPRGNSLALIRHLLASQKWQVDMCNPIQPEKVLNLISEK